MASRDAIRTGAVARRPRGGTRATGGADTSSRRATGAAGTHRVPGQPEGVVAAIIAGHSAFGYAPANLGAWPYQDVREVSLARASQVILAIPLAPAGLFAMGLFFLISGVVTPGSVARKGPGRFARDRVVRLGVPLATWTLGIWPSLLLIRDRWGGNNPFATFWFEFLHRPRCLNRGRCGS